MNFFRTVLLTFLFFSGSSFVPVKRTFEEIQKTYGRVNDCYERKEDLMKMRCRSLEIPEETFGKMFIRVFKMESVMEVWVQKPDGKYVMFRQFDIYAISGLLGPKRKEGDRQVPEGFYYINQFNPESSYYLSLGINYPNETDMKLSDAPRKGGDIYIHGAMCSAGCMAMSNYYIEDIYMCAVKARSNGQEKIPVAIFPFRMTDKNMMYYNGFDPYNRYTMFWNNLKKGYAFFEKYKRVPDIAVAQDGSYLFSDPAAAEACK